MFGFMRLNPQNLKSTPEGVEQEILVSREDIYRRERGSDPILLLRKGFELTADELPRFLKNGAQMHQFGYKHSNVPLKPSYSRPGRPEAMRKPAQWDANQPTGPANLPTGFQQKRVLIVEPNQKDLKRLIDCLFICGLRLDRIHPVRVAANTPWAVEKYRPQILVADLRMMGQLDGLTILQAFTEFSFVERLILTIPAGYTLSTDENQVVQTLKARKNIKILSKPVNRFVLQRILQEVRPEASNNAMMGQIL